MANGNEGSIPGNAGGHWHIGREVPLALIATIVIVFTGQVVGGVWWASNMSARLTALESQTAAIAAARENRGERLARVETQVGYVAGAIQRIEKMMSRWNPL